MKIWDKMESMREMFDKAEIIRTLGFYQPFGSLMLHGKKETRWCRVNRKPSFPFGKYLLYTTKKKCDNATLFEWCGAEIMSSIIDTLKGESTNKLFGYALCIGELQWMQDMKEADEESAFVKYRGLVVRKDKKGVEHTYKQKVLNFGNIQRIQPFTFDFGKQGVGILPESEYKKVVVI